MLEIEGIEFQYRHSDFQLRIPKLFVERGAKVALVGPSGSGKTTLLSLLSGVEVAGRGRVRVDDVELGRMTDAERRDFRIAEVGMVFQDFELIEYLNVRENILLPYLINRRLRLTADVRKAAEQLAHSAGISPLLERNIGKLSHGERQRVAICRALLPRPHLILADEPTGNLDPDNKGRVLEMLIGHAAANDATLLVVTHDHALLDEFDRVINFADFHAVPRDDKQPAFSSGK